MQILGLATIGGFLGCASSGPIVAKDVSNSVWLMPSNSHEIATLNIKKKSGQLVLEGKVKQLSAKQEKAGHVKVSIIGPDSTLLGTKTIALAPKTKRDKHGKRWSRSSEIGFTTKLGTAIPKDAIVVVAFDDSP
jgi:hypothetical protein